MDLNISSIQERIENGEIIEENIVSSVITKLMELLCQERNVLLLHSPITICGDIHGQLDDLLHLFKKSGKVTGNNNYLFMGDYVDRGYYSLNTFLYLACYKLKYPNSFFLLRGNHESRQVSQMYGFHSECTAYYGHTGLWMLCNDAFDLLPIAALIDNKIFSVHGGLAPDAPYVDCISTVDRQDEVPQSGIVCDLLWSDPDNVKAFRQNPRGAGFMFGDNEVQNFCQLNKLKLITRSHQLANDGYQFFFQKNPKPRIRPKEGDVISFDSENKLPAQIVTIWSAPNYMYRSGNLASIMKYNGQQYDIIIFDKNPKRMEPKYERRDGSSYFS